MQKSCAAKVDIAVSGAPITPWWLRTFAGPFIGRLQPDLQSNILADVERRLIGLHDPAEGWIADYARLRFDARKQS